MSHDGVSDHYGQDSLLESIANALAAVGKTPETVTLTDLAPVGEFHIGGAQATTHLLEKLGFPPDARVLDIGCGIGGPARMVAGQVSSVAGIDLTEVYVETGRTLNRWLGLADRIDLRTGDALAMPFETSSFDGAIMLHVGMNVADKPALLAEAARVLRPGARLGIYDVMRVAAGEFEFPVPWANDAGTSHVASMEDYRRGAEAAGLEVVDEESRGDFAVRFFEGVRARGAPSPLGLQLLMGPSAPTKLGNLAAAVGAGTLAPMELILAK